jgi:hypothetical protein
LNEELHNAISPRVARASALLDSTSFRMLQPIPHSDAKTGGVTASWSVTSHYEEDSEDYEFTVHVAFKRGDHKVAEFNFKAQCEDCKSTLSRSQSYKKPSLSWDEAKEEGHAWWDPASGVVLMELSLFSSGGAGAVIHHTGTIPID